MSVDGGLSEDSVWRRNVIIHDYCEPGWEQRGEYDSFWDWFMEAVEEMIHETGPEEQQ